MTEIVDGDQAAPAALISGELPGNMPVFQVLQRPS